VGLGYFYETDVVISCLDNREARLWVNRCCWKTNTPWVDGAIQEINGVVKVFVPPDSACYECGMTEVDYRLINLRYSCPLLRQEDMQAGKVPTAPTIASMIGGLQTQEAVKLLHGLPTASGEALVFNGVANQFYRTRFQRRDDCLSHETYPPPISAPLPALTTTACQLMDFLRQQRPEADGLRLVLDRDLVVSLECVTCGVKQQVMRPLPAVGMREGACPQCRQPMRPEVQHTVTGDSSLATQTLAALGVPRFDIVRLESAEDEFAVLLAADRQPEARHAPSTSG
jgi:molybdopterin-synthase adenylyltransferase